MERRSFIGTVLGMITSLNIPLRAESAVFITGSGLDRIKRMIRMFEVPEYLLQRFKCGLILDNDETIAMKHTCEVSRDVENLTVRFRFYSIKMQVPMTVKGMVLIDDLDYEVRRKLFNMACCLTIGDTFRVYYDLDVKQLDSQ